MLPTYVTRKYIYNYILQIKQQFPTQVSRNKLIYDHQGRA